MADAPVAQQYLRSCSLVVFGRDLNGIDLSELRIKFVVKRSDTMTPNTADIRVYNLDDKTAQFIKSQFGTVNRFNGTGNGQVVLQGGYEANKGVIFQGNIKQVIIGRESATDTFIDIIAGDGDRAYNYAVVNQTIAAGATQSDQVGAAVGAMSPKGVTSGNTPDLPKAGLPRGKVMYGPSKNYLREVAETSGQTWSIQDSKVTFVPLKSYLPGQAVVLTSNTGMIGTPQQTTEGVNVKMLMNPLIRIGTRVQIDNKSIEQLKINLNQPGSAANIPAPLTADGVYYVLVAEHSGDTRGTDWYTSLITLNIDVTTNPLNSVQVGYG